MTFESVAACIEKNRGAAVDFGNASCELVPSNERIRETENDLGQKLPPSYVWFLRNYGGGSVFGDEIFSIRAHRSPSDMTDIATRTLKDREKGFIAGQDIAVCFTDFGEQFVLDASSPDERGEYPVIVIFGNTRQVVASDFADFLVKLIHDDIR